jgi:hemoglobin
VKKLAALACVLFACGGSTKPSSTTTAKKADTAESKDAPAAGESGEAAPAESAKTDPASLYVRLGKKEAITAVVDEFIGRVAADARIKHRFFNTDIPKLKRLLVELVCMATGGPCRYSGLDMETSHAGMEIVEEEFTALVEDLAGALDKFKVPAKEKGELLGALGPMAPQMVTPKDRLKPVSDALVAKATGVAVKLTGEAADVMQAAIVAAKRGQRNYADQLFSRVEQLTGPKVVAAAAPTFRDGAPPRIDTPLKKMKDTGPQAVAVGNSDDDDKGPKLPASLSGYITIDGKPIDGLGMVMLWPEKGKAKRRTPKQRLVEQRDKTFLPRVLAVPPGSTVAFPNFDGVFHNVFSISAPKKFDVGLYKDGDTREVKFEKAGIVRLGCNIHAKMASYIVVVDAPHYIVAEGAKEFTFKSLQPGKYKVRAWSEKSAAPVESQIEIKAGVNNMNFDVKADAESGPSEDKFGMTRQPFTAKK